MKRIVFRLALAVAGVGFGVAIALAVLGRVYLTPDRLAHEVSALFGREVEIRGPVGFSFWGEPRLTLSQLRIRNPPGSSFKHLAIVDTISIGLRWWNLPTAIGSPAPHVLDIRLDGGKVHVDSRQDVVGDDGVWPSADDPFTGMLSWVDTLQASDINQELQADKERIEKIFVQTLNASFDTGEDGAVIIDAEEFELTVAGVPVKGSLELDAPVVRPGNAPPATLTGKLEIDEVDLGATLGPPSPGGSPLPLDEPLPVHACLSWHADLAFSIGTVRFEIGEVTDVRGSVRSSEGNWSGHLDSANFPAGKGQGEVSLHCGELPGEFDLRSRVGSKGKADFSQEGAAVEVMGRMESILTLAGKGSTWKEVVGDFAGRFAAFLGPVRTGALEGDFYARSLFHALTVSWGQSKKAVVDCAVVDMKIEKGVARSQQIVIGTPTLVIDGHGQVELLEDRVDIVLIPRPKHIRLGTVHAPVMISGSIQNPQFGPDWKDVLPRFGIETATALVKPLLGTLPLDGIAKEEREACRRSLEPLEMSAGARAD